MRLFTLQLFLLCLTLTVGLEGTGQEHAVVIWTTSLPSSATMEMLWILLHQEVREFEDDTTLFVKIVLIENVRPAWVRLHLFYVYR